MCDPPPTPDTRNASKLEQRRDDRQFKLMRFSVSGLVGGGVRSPPYPTTGSQPSTGTFAGLLCGERAPLILLPSRSYAWPPAQSSAKRRFQREKQERARARSLTPLHSFLESSFWIQQKAGMGEGARSPPPPRNKSSFSNHSIVISFTKNDPRK